MSTPWQPEQQYNIAICKHPKSFLPATQHSSRCTYDEWPFAAVTFTDPELQLEEQNEPQQYRQHKAGHHHKVEETCSTQFVKNHPGYNKAICRAEKSNLLYGWVCTCKIEMPTLR